MISILRENFGYLFVYVMLSCRRSLKKAGDRHPKVELWLCFRFPPESLVSNQCQYPEEKNGHGVCRRIGDQPKTTI